MRLTTLEKECLMEALLYATTDYEAELLSLIEYEADQTQIKTQRQTLKGMQRAKAKLLKEVV